MTTDWKGPFAGAYRKGRQASEDGKSLTDCPYTDKRTDHKNGVTFSRAFVKAWYEGFRYQEKENGAFDALLVQGFHPLMQENEECDGCAKGVDPSSRRDAKAAVERAIGGRPLPRA